MKKFNISLFLMIIFLLVGCSTKILPVLGGGYQSERTIDGYVIQMGIQPEDNTFIQYIDNREVDKGSYEEKSDGIYLLKSDKQEFEITLTKEDSFKIIIEQLNNNKPILLKNISKIPTYLTTELDDVEEYKKLLDRK